MATRVFCIILDGLGVGDLPDSRDFGDEGCNTLAHVAASAGGLHLPCMEGMGLGRIQPFAGMNAEIPVTGFHGRMAEKSMGKDSTTGHWELAGLLTPKSFPLFPDGFPELLLKDLSERTGYEFIGNEAASGTEIIQRLGDRHVRTGKLIVYTSADSVFQVAAHEDVVPLDDLYAFCEKVRDLLTGEFAVSRVIARPFHGESGNYQRSDGRHDYSLSPSGPTLLDRLLDGGVPVTGVGKVKDLFAGRGFSSHMTSHGNREGMSAFQSLLGKKLNRAFNIVNLVDFDMLWGHRNDPEGYAQGLVDFDRWLTGFVCKLSEGDILFITADHGNDPTTKGTDHSREYVPILGWGPGMKRGLDLGRRESFADFAETVLDIFDLAPLETGKSFWPELKGSLNG